MTIELVLFTYNEIEGSRVIVPRIPRDHANAIFAVDGGSTDGTVEYLEAQGIPVLRQGADKGRGAAFRIAFKHTNADALICFSPDGNEDPADIPKFRGLLEKGNDIVIASRMMKGAYNEEDEHLLRWRKWANLSFGWLANVFFNKAAWVSDTINGFRAVRTAAFAQLSPDGPGYTIEYQMSIRAMKKRLRIVEFPTREGARIGGESYAKSLPTGCAFLKLFWRELWLR